MSETYTKYRLRGSVTEPYQPRSITDRLIDGLTPIMIFVMSFSVVYFLLDVRYIYTEVHDKNLRFVAFCFLVGIVALNRLIVWEGMQEGFMYFLGLAAAVIMYTMTTTSVYGVGSVARGFMNTPWVALTFNLTIVFFLWWLVHRLAKECCIDENPEAGDIGLLTNTLRRAKKSIEAKPEPKEEEFYDPTEWKKPEPKPILAPLEASRRLPKRHPGISVFYFSVPVMFLFAIGLPVLQQGGRWMILAGHFYVGLYTVSALMLLMLTSLGGLREYFRSRHVHIPPGIGPFWIGLGMVMIAVVCFGATALPMPDLPPIAAVDAHQKDFWSRGSTFELSVAAPAAAALEQSHFMRRVGQGVLLVLALFLAYAALRSAGAIAARIARQRYRYAPWVVRLFDRIDRLLQRFANLPSLPALTPAAPRVRPEIAISARYRNPMGDAARAGTMTSAEIISNAYEALCALAYDLGVPRRDDQTPYEFIASFPPALDRLREEATELTDLFVRANYSRERLDPRVEDRVRKFWIQYERIRNRIVR